MRRCAAIKANGERCKGDAVPGSDQCWSHHPDYAEERRRRASKGGKKAGRGRPLTELRALRAENGLLREQMLKGELSPGKLAVAVQSINVDIRCLEVELKAKEQEDLEVRMEALEEALENKKAYSYGT
jgi:hypothetical protein